MLKRIIGISGIGIALLLALVFTTAVFNAQAYDSKSNRGGGVRVDVTPVTLAAGQPSVFEVRLNTHSVDLSQDLAKAAYLEDGSGNKILPQGWTGDPPGGHHRRGELSFPALADGVSGVKLVITGVGGAAPRVFEWSLEQ